MAADAQMGCISDHRGRGMSAELETLLNDLIMKAERTSAEFRQEVANAKRVEEALHRIRQLNGQAFNEALALMQSQSFNRMVDHPPMPPIPVLGQVAWN